MGKSTFHWCSAEAALEQLRPRRGSQVWEGSKLTGGSVVSTSGRGPGGVWGSAGREGKWLLAQIRSIMRGSVGSSKAFTRGVGITCTGARGGPPDEAAALHWRLHLDELNWD